MDEILKELRQALDATTGQFQTEISGVRSNRPSVGLLEDVKVEAYGQTMSVRELGSLSIQPPRDILVTVWDASVGPAVQKAIETGRMGYSVSGDGATIRVTLPALTEERRAELSKLVKKMTEASRISVRGHRDDANKRVKAAQDAKTLNEDQAFKAKEQIQKLVDQANQKIEGVLNSKLAEIAE